MSFTLTSRIKLNDGRLMPIFGLGLYQAATSSKTTQIIHDAIRLGYPLIDTAELYRNESQVGEALKKTLNREEIFISTKLFRTNDGRQGLRRSFQNSLQQLGTNYIDLYLIHAPQGGHVLEVYKEMIQLQKEGHIRSIGVSNFGVQHLKWLKQAGFVPAVNQIELHPWWQNEEIVDYCRTNNIAIMGYSPLGKGHFLNDPFLIKLSERYGKTPAQILIRWSVQNGYITIPKTTSGIARLKENMDVFDFNLSDEDMKGLTNYGKKNPQNTGWDPTTNNKDKFGPV
jgi:diketogulonate reductase-like aldo/keto reductase